VNELKGASSVEDNGLSSSSQRKEPFTFPGLPGEDLFVSDSAENYPVVES